MDRIEKQFKITPYKLDKQGQELICPLCDKVFSKYINHNHLVYVGVKEILLIVNQILQREGVL